MTTTTQHTDTQPPELTLAGLLHYAAQLRDVSIRADMDGVHIAAGIHNVPRRLFDGLAGEVEQHQRSEDSAFWTRVDHGVTFYTREPPRAGEPDCPHCRGTPRVTRSGTEYVCAWCLGDGACDSPDCEHNRSSVETPAAAPEAVSQ